MLFISQPAKERAFCQHFRRVSAASPLAIDVRTPHICARILRGALVHAARIPAETAIPEELLRAKLLALVDSIVDRMPPAVRLSPACCR